MMSRGSLQPWRDLRRLLVFLVEWVVMTSRELQLLLLSSLWEASVLRMWKEWELRRATLWWWCRLAPKALAGKPSCGQEMRSRRDTPGTLFTGVTLVTFLLGHKKGAGRCVDDFRTILRSERLQYNR